MVSAMLPLSSAEPARREITKATTAIAATRVAFAICTASAPLWKKWDFRNLNALLCSAMALIGR
jgi:hypothetical protein